MIEHLKTNLIIMIIKDLPEEVGIRLCMPGYSAPLPIPFSYVFDDPKTCREDYGQYMYPLSKRSGATTYSSPVLRTVHVPEWNGSHNVSSIQHKNIRPGRYS